MNDAGTILMIVGVLVMFLVMFLCVRKEKELVGFYKAIGVCGRWYNFLMGLFLVAGGLCVVLFVISLVAAVMGGAPEWTKFLPMPGEGWMGVLLSVIYGVICFAIGGLLYKHVAKRVPEELRKGFLKDVLIMFFGTNLRISFFFLAFVGFLNWWTCRPIAYTVNGKKCYSYGNGNELYDEHGNQVGTKSGLNEAIMTDSSYRS